MNERIQTMLANFKETESLYHGAHVLLGLDEIETFAEWIVNECLVVINQSNGVGDDDVIKISRDVKKHFGIEE